MRTVFALCLLLAVCTDGVCDDDPLNPIEIGQVIYLIGTTPSGTQTGNIRTDITSIETSQASQSLSKVANAVDVAALNGTTSSLQTSMQQRISVDASQSLSIANFGSVVECVFVVAPYELTPTTGPNDDGVIYQETINGGIRLDNLAYAMENPPTQNTSIQLSDGSYSVTATIPTGSDFGTVNLTSSFMVASGDVLTFSVVSGTGGTPQSLKFCAATATSSTKTGQDLSNTASPGFAGITIAGISNTAYDIKVTSQQVAISSSFTVDWDFALQTNSAQIYSHSITIAESVTSVFDDTVNLYWYNDPARRGSSVQYTTAGIGRTGVARIYSTEAAVAPTAGNNFAITSGANMVRPKDLVTLYSSVASQDEVMLVSVVSGNTIFFEDNLLYNHAIGENIARKLVISGLYHTGSATHKVWCRAVFGSEATTTLATKETRKR